MATNKNHPGKECAGGYIKRGPGPWRKPVESLASVFLPHHEPIKESNITNIIVADTLQGNNLLVEHIKDTHTFIIKNQK